MKLTIVCVVVGLIAATFVCDSNAQMGGPGIGWAIGQQASLSAVSFAIDSALAKSDGSTLPPELQVSVGLWAVSRFDVFLWQNFHTIQEELEQMLADARKSMTACDDLLLTAPVWRYKICKFQALGAFKTQLMALQAKATAAAAAAAAAAATSTAAPAPADVPTDA